MDDLEVNTQSTNDQIEKEKEKGAAHSAFPFSRCFWRKSYSNRLTSWNLANYIIVESNKWSAPLRGI